MLENFLLSKQRASPLEAIHQQGDESYRLGRVFTMKTVHP
jgi:hypothetical protein